MYYDPPLERAASSGMSVRARVFATGMALGAIGVVVSLLCNIVGALIVGMDDPFKLLRVYLTFPLGESVLTESPFRVDNLLLLGASFGLYLGAGMLLGGLFHGFLTRWLVRPTFPRRFITATALSVAVWGLVVGGILSWLQPLLIGGSWIVQQIPLYIGVLTNLAFGWTILVLPDLWRLATRRGGAMTPAPAVVTGTPSGDSTPVTPPVEEAKVGGRI
jgi:hypothetical protein